MNKYKIEGMHCDACKSLITMELEDAGILEGFSIDKEEQTIEVTDSTIEPVIVECINKMDMYSLTKID